MISLLEAIDSAFCKAAPHFTRATQDAAEIKQLRAYNPVAARQRLRQLVALDLLISASDTSDPINNVYAALRNIRGDTAYDYESLSAKWEALAEYCREMADEMLAAREGELDAMYETQAEMLAGR